MSLVLQSSGGGSVTIAEPTTASNFTQNLPAADGAVMISPQALTIPDVTGTVMVSGNMPAFSAYANVSQTISSATFTKVTFGVEDYDTNNNFASSTFTPTVAGYYQINLTGGFFGSGSPTREIIALYKNGSVLLRVFDSSVLVSIASGSILVYMNGSSDYLDVYALMTSTGTVVISSTLTSETFRINGSLVRAA